MAELTRSCENCGNLRCANSMVAFWWDECVKSNFEKHWMPRCDMLPPLQDGEDIEDLVRQIERLKSYEG